MAELFKFFLFLFQISRYNNLNRIHKKKIIKFVTRKITKVILQVHSVFKAKLHAFSKVNGVSIHFGWESNKC